MIGQGLEANNLKNLAKQEGYMKPNLGDVTFSLLSATSDKALAISKGQTFT